MAFNLVVNHKCRVYLSFLVVICVQITTEFMSSNMKDLVVVICETVYDKKDCEQFKLA